MAAEYTSPCVYLQAPAEPDKKQRGRWSERLNLNVSLSFSLSLKVELAAPSLIFEVWNIWIP